MKKVLITFLFILSFMLGADAQYNSGHKSSYKDDSGPKIGLCITGAGVAFSVAGFLTPPDYTWVQTSPTTTTAGYWHKKPFMEQGARSMCIVTGVTLTVTGLITMLTGN